MQLDARLRAFAAVVRQGSFSRAASELFVSQPAVSKHVAALEAELGSELVVRGRRGVTLTPPGRMLADYVLRAEALLANARRAVEAADTESGTVTVAASGIPGEYLLPGFLPAFLERHPRVWVEVRLVMSAQALQLVRAHEVELALFGGFTAPEDLEVEPLVQDDVVLVGPPALASRRLRPQDLKQFRWISREEGSATRAAVESAQWQLGLGSIDTLELPSWQAVKAAVAAGGGIAAISRFAIEHELASGALAVLDVPRWHVERLISLAVARDVPLTPAAARFRAVLREVELPIRSASTAARKAGPDDALPLMQLGVFVGGFERDAAEYVCEAGVDLDRLAAQGTLFRDGRRFVLTDEAGVTAADANDDVRRRHAEFFASLVEDFEPRLSRTGEDDWTRRLIRERENIDAALAWSASHAERELQLRIAGSCWQLWLELGYPEAWLQWLEEALSEVQDARLRLLALPTLGWHAFSSGNLDRAEMLAEERLRLGRELDDEGHVAGGLTLVAEVTERRGDLRAARRLYEEALAVDRRPGNDERLIPHLLNYAALLIRSGELEAADDATAEAAGIARVRGADRMIAAAAENAAVIALLRDRPERALDLLQETLRRRGPEESGLIWTALELTGIALIGDERHEQGVRFLGLARRIRADRGDELDSTFTALHERAVGRARSALGARPFARAHSRGERLSPTVAIAELS